MVIVLWASTASGLWQRHPGLGTHPPPAFKSALIHSNIIILMVKSSNKMLSCNNSANNTLTAPAFTGNGQPRSGRLSSGLIPAASSSPSLPAPTLHKGNLVPAVGDAGEPLERGPHHQPTGGWQGGESYQTCRWRVSQLTFGVRAALGALRMLPLGSALIGYHGGPLGSGGTQWHVVCLTGMWQDPTSSQAAQQVSLLTA